MIKIAQLSPEHASALNELLKVGLREFPSSFTSDLPSIENRPDEVVADRLRKLQLSDDFRLGAFDDDELVGTVSLVRQQEPKQSHAADIVFLFVRANCQNEGIGRMLMESAIERAKLVRGLEDLHLSVSQDAKAAIHVYEKMGFSSTGVIKRQLKEKGKYHDLVTMWVHLNDA